MASLYAQAQTPVTSFAAGPATTAAQQYGVNTTAGNLLYFLIAWDSAATISGVTEVTNGAYTSLPEITNGVHHIQLFYKLSCVGVGLRPTPTATFTPVLTATNIQVTVAEYTIPVGNVMALDAHDEAATGTSVAVQSNAIAPTNNPYELILVYADGAVVSLTWAGSPGNILRTGTGPTAAIRSALGDMNLAGTVGVFGNFVISASNAWCCGIVSFSPGLPMNAISPQITGGYHDMGGAIVNTNGAFSVGGVQAQNTYKTNVPTDAEGNVAPQVGQIYPWTSFIK